MVTERIWLRGKLSYRGHVSVCGLRDQGREQRSALCATTSSTGHAGLSTRRLSKPWTSIQRLSEWVFSDLRLTKHNPPGKLSHLQDYNDLGAGRGDFKVFTCQSLTIFKRQPGFGVHDSCSSSINALLDSRADLMCLVSSSCEPWKHPDIFDTSARLCWTPMDLYALLLSVHRTFKRCREGFSDTGASQAT